MFYIYSDEETDRTDDESEIENEQKIEYGN